MLQVPRHWPRAVSSRAVPRGVLRLWGIRASLPDADSAGRGRRVFPDLLRISF